MYSASALDQLHVRRQRGAQRRVLRYGPVQGHMAQLGAVAVRGSSDGVASQVYPRQGGRQLIAGPEKPSGDPTDQYQPRFSPGTSRSGGHSRSFSGIQQ